MWGQSANLVLARKLTGQEDETQALGEVVQCYMAAVRLPAQLWNDIGNAQNILEAQLSLLTANNGTTQIAVSLLDNAPPAPSDTDMQIVAALQAAQASLNKVFEDSINPNTASAVKAANSSIATALASAQQAVAVNCQTTLN
ncbi:hypothetical protein B0H16DRAFT_1483686 [Mycena metata]|uniref:Uncharacterized protein n=1 Tax=Mycena metata TaxID=1033252 RepID=A0AAD7GM15_9AGAR|nr:hypothetical protein B0H16DRAFT_1483686 [Mycena metata]